MLQKKAVSFPNKEFLFSCIAQISFPYLYIYKALKNIYKNNNMHLKKEI